MAEREEQCKGWGDIEAVEFVQQVEAVTRIKLVVDIAKHLQLEESAVVFSRVYDASSMWWTCVLPHDLHEPTPTATLPPSRPPSSHVKNPSEKCLQCRREGNLTATQYAPPDLSLKLFELHSVNLLRLKVVLLYNFLKTAVMLLCCTA